MAETLQRSHRALSQAELPSSFTPLSTNDAANASSRRVRLSSLLTSNARSNDSKTQEGAEGGACSFDSTFTTRGFDARPDLFAALEQEMLAKRFGGVGKDAGADNRQDEWWERLGASASKFGRWSEGDGVRWGRAQSSWREDWEDSDDEQEEYMYTEKSGPKASCKAWTSLEGAKRIPLGVAVWHDRCEESEDPDVDFDYFRPSSSATSPFSTPSLSCSQLSSLGTCSNPPSPTFTRSCPLRSPPISRRTQSSRKGSILDEQDIDNLAHSFLASQDRFGLFGFAERLLEWPFSSSDADQTFNESEPQANTLTPSSSHSPSAPLSRIPSSHSLVQQPSSPARLHQEAWTEPEEISAYAKAVSAEMDRRDSQSAVSDAERRRAERVESVCEALGALLDSVGRCSLV